MKNQSSASVWTASSTARVAVLEPSTGFYPGTGTLGRGRTAGRGGESVMKLALALANCAIWMYVAVLPVGLVA